MSFTGKATYASGSSRLELAEDVSDLVSIVSPHETPLLDLLGDPLREARSTVHEWLEDQLLPNDDALNGFTGDATNTDTLNVAHVARFRVGDQVRAGSSTEVMLVVGVDSLAGTITVTRGYGNSDPQALSAGAELRILGNAALEGDSADAARFTVRNRRQNYTQIFTATVEVSGSELATRQLGVVDEMNYQKQLRLREMLRDLENCAINGRATMISSAGSVNTRRTMNGLLALAAENRFKPGDGILADETALSEAMLNTALREIWLSSGAPVDTILVHAQQKRQINQFASTQRQIPGAEQTYRDRISAYESDFGVCRVVLSRYVPRGTVLLLDSTRVEIMPLAGRSFFYKPLASTGDRESGQLVGEYTLELRNPEAHGVISGLVG